MKRRGAGVLWDIYMCACVFVFTACSTLWYDVVSYKFTTMKLGIIFNPIKVCLKIS